MKLQTMQILKSYLIFFFLLFQCSDTITDSIEGKVIGVKDGDTIEVLHQGKPLKVRLFGIDSPEKKQAFGDIAKEFTSRASFGKNVTIVKKGTDKYRRLLGIVFLPSGENLNHELVRHGLAWRYKYSKDPILGELEKEAQKKKVGLWSHPSPLSPWDFRKIKRKKVK